MHLNILGANRSLQSQEEGNRCGTN